MGEGYRDLVVWQKAMDLTEEIYLLTRTFPSEEKFGLTSQMRRAASSVPANIAEGRERRYAKDFGRFIMIALGSLAELETFLELSKRLNLIKEEQSQCLFQLTDEIGKMLNGLKRSIEAGD